MVLNKDASLLAFILFIITYQVVAQDQTDAITQVRIEEIVVTAQKRPENIQDVPISISVYSGDFLDDSGIDTLQDLSAYTPNLTLSQSSQTANQRIIMRGVGSVGNNAIEPSVAVFIDGVYYPRPSSVVGTLSDLELVEVLRGPQGTLFGRNASMGALNITTMKPSEDLSGQIRGSFGSFDAIRLSGSVSNSISDQTSGRLSFHYSDRDGYGNNTFTGADNNSKFGAREDKGLRGKLNFTPSDILDINMTFDYSEVKNESGVIEVLADSVLPAYVGTLSAALNPLGPAPGGPVPETTNTFDYTVNQDHRDNADDEQWGGVMDISWDIKNHTVRSISSYRNWKNSTFESALRLPADLLNRVTDYDADTLSQEFQLLSPTGNYFEYVLGFYYYNEDYTIDQQFDLGTDFCPLINNLVFSGAFRQALAAGAPLATAQAIGAGAGAAGAAQCAGGPQTAAIDTDFNQDLISYAGFGHFTVNISEYLRFTGGLRWTADGKDGSFEQLVPNTILLPPSATNPLAINLRTIDSDPNLAFDDDELTWMANVNYDVNDNLMIFATASTGFKSGGFNSDGANVIIPRVFSSEDVINYELGFKSYLFENKLVANLTLFNTKITNFQDRQFNGVNFIVQNAGKLNQKGLELDMRLQANENLSAVAGVSYLDSNFTSFPQATALPFEIVVGSTATRDLTGERNHFSPRWQLSLMTEWRDTIGDEGYGYYIRGEFQQVSGQNVGAQTNQNPQSRQDGYSLLNARGAITGQHEKWEVAAFAKNLTDETVCQTIFNQPIGITLRLVDSTTLGGMQRCVLGAPKTYGVEAVYRF
jgi:iron complex outermembrane receptor protein